MSTVWTFHPREIQKHKPSGKDFGNGFTLKGDNGSAVILAHGLTGTPNEMRFLAGYLNKRGHTVVCPRRGSARRSASSFWSRVWTMSVSPPCLCQSTLAR